MLGFWIRFSMDLFTSRPTNSGWSSIVNLSLLKGIFFLLPPCIFAGESFIFWKEVFCWCLCSKTVWSQPYLFLIACKHSIKAEKESFVALDESWEPALFLMHSIPAISTMVIDPPDRTIRLSISCFIVTTGLSVIIISPWEQCDLASELGMVWLLPRYNHLLASVTFRHVIMEEYVEKFCVSTSWSICNSWIGLSNLEVWSFLLFLLTL